jgi:hypothetical protein
MDEAVSGGIKIIKIKKAAEYTCRLFLWDLFCA